MEEKTNQPEASSELKFSPEDFTADELGAKEPENTEGQPDEAVEAKSVEVEKHKIKYNGKEEEYSTEELITLAQKGRNYDHVLKEKDELKNSDEMKMLSNLAKEAGMKDVKSFLDNLQSNLINLKLEERAKKLESEGIPLEHARRMADLEMKAEAKAVAEPEKQEDSPLVNQFTELFNEFPETKEFKTLEEYPDEVQKMIEEGKSPLVAYTKYITAQKDKEIELAKQNAEAKSRDTGSFKSGKQDTKEDDFLKGLLG